MKFSKNALNFKIIAEVGSNWNGDIKTGKKIIKKLKDANADAVKFQMWRANDLYDTNHPNWNQIRKSELTPKHALEFKKHSDGLKIDCFWSVFYPEAVDFLENLNVKFYKIASRTSALVDQNSLETMHAMHSGDFYPHHVDAEFAKKGPFGQRVAQFSCTFSIGIALTAELVNKKAFTYGFDRLRFPNPVFIGDTITATVKVAERYPEKQRLLCNCLTKNQDGKIVIDSKFLIKILNA